MVYIWAIGIGEKGVTNERCSDESFGGQFACSRRAILLERAHTGHHFYFEVKMSDLLMNRRMQWCANHFEHLLAHDEVKWRFLNERSVKKLLPSTFDFLQKTIPHGLPIWLANREVNGVFLFKIWTIPDVLYLQHDGYNAVHLWAGPGFHEALISDRVVERLARYSTFRLN